MLEYLEIAILAMLELIFFILYVSLIILKSTGTNSNALTPFLVILTVNNRLIINNTYINLEVGRST